jgi:hypothetical protein
LQEVANVCQTGVTVPCCLTVIKLALTNNSTVTTDYLTDQNSKQHFRGTKTLPSDEPTVTDPFAHPVFQQHIVLFVAA